jgi:hypothetical protein
MAAKKLKYAAMVFAIDSVMIAVMTATYFYFIPSYRQMCGETSVYFVKFGLYGCDSNARLQSILNAMAAMAQFNMHY